LYLLFLQIADHGRSSFLEFVSRIQDTSGPTTGTEESFGVLCCAIAGYIYTKEEEEEGSVII